MGTTTNYGFPYPAGSDVNDVPADLQALAEAVDTQILASAYGVIAAQDVTASVGAGSITINTKFAIPGLTATWTADPTHLYRIDGSVYWLFGTGVQAHRHWIIASDTSTDKYLWIHDSIGSAVSGGTTYLGGGFCFLTGLSGSVTWSIYGMVTDGSSHNSQTLDVAGQMIITDLGLAP